MPSSTTEYCQICIRGLPDSYVRNIKFVSGFVSPRLSKLLIIELNQFITLKRLSYDRMCSMSAEYLAVFLFNLNTITFID